MKYALEFALHVQPVRFAHARYAVETACLIASYTFEVTEHCCKLFKAEESFPDDLYGLTKRETLANMPSIRSLKWKLGLQYLSRSQTGYARPRLLDAPVVLRLRRLGASLSTEEASPPIGEFTRVSEQSRDLQRKTNA